MAQTGNQTSLYNKLVITFVAIGGTVRLLPIAISHRNLFTDHIYRPMAMQLQSSEAQLANQAGTNSSTSLKMANQATTRSLHQRSLQRTVCSLLVVRSRV